MLRRVLLVLLAVVLTAPAVASAAPHPHGAVGALTGPGTCFAHTALEGCETGELDLPFASVVSPDGRNVYVTAMSGVRAFSRAADGRLTALTGDGSCLGAAMTSWCAVTRPGLAYAETIIASEDGRSLYVALRDHDTVLVLDRDPATGRITPLSGPGGCVANTGNVDCPTTRTRLDNPMGLALSPDGRFLYVSTFNSGSIVALARDGATGRLTPLTGPGACVQQAGADGCGKVEGAARFASLALTPDGRHAYTASRDAHAIFGVDVDPASGRLTPMTGPGRCVQDGTGGPGTVCDRTTPGLVEPYALATIGGGAGLVTSGTGSGALRAFAIGPDGRIAPSNCVAGPGGSAACVPGGVPLQSPAWLTATPDGRSVLAPGGAVSSVRTNGATLAAHPTGRCVAHVSQTGQCPELVDHLAAPQHVSVAPDGATAYAVAESARVLRVLRVEVAPTCAPLALATTAGAPASAPAPCRDANGDPVTHDLVEPPAHGTAAIDAAGTLRYTPAPGFVGTDRLVVRASDGTNESAPSAVAVTVAPAPAAPAAPAAPVVAGSSRGAGQDGGRAQTNRPGARKATLAVAGRLIVRGPSVQLSLSCPTARCTGVVKLTARRRTLASAKVDLPAGAKRTVTAKLTRAGRRALRGKRTATARLTFVPAGASRPALTRTVTLKRG